MTPILEIGKIYQSKYHLHAFPTLQNAVSAFDSAYRHVDNKYLRKDASKYNSATTTARSLAHILKCSILLIHPEQHLLLVDKKLQGTLLCYQFLYEDSLVWVVNFDWEKFLSLSFVGL